MKFCLSFPTKCFQLLLFILIASHSWAKVTLPTVITDNMVLQQKTNAALWGKADAGKSIAITTGWNSQKYTAVVDANGDWKVKVSTPSFGGPYIITINDGDEVKLNNVLIGEVWVCSGQSNMEMPLAGWGKIFNYEEEIAQANFPSIRLLQLDHITSNVPIKEAKVSNNGWTMCTPEYVANFSSVAYFFAREIHNKTRIPIGLIHTSWGGTIAEAWISGTTLKTTEDFAAATTAIEKSAGSESKEDFQLKLKDWENKVLTKDAGYNNGQAVWAATNTSGDWKTMKQPGLWESTALPEFDGVVWFKKKINIPAAMAGKEVTLSLGTIDDNDITWLNGEKVGETTGYNVNRKYTIPPNLVKEGENELTVRVFDGSGGGGFYDDTSKLFLAGGDGQTLSLAGDWQYKVGLNLKDVGAGPVQNNGPNRPSVLFNAMINPILNYTIKGAIWYQGESNAGRAYQYRWLFPTLIKDWRKQWGVGEFPFYFVQLANFMKPYTDPEESAWAELREAQLMTLSLPNTGMAVTIDIGNDVDIHPKNKQDVGKRLALIALAKNYGKTMAFSGPMYQSQTIEGNKIRLNFKYVEEGLKAKEGSTLAGFEIAGADKKFYKATAGIQGRQVVVSSSDVAKPIAVRYDWANNPDGNLFNTADLPASPFRTDNRAGVTAGKK
ncbi:MAG: 9-O-acetylesterase [Chitinophagaceae bacterium]|nr:9-O-acetylesterase [Chitinophagaceae bacterium]